MAFALVLFDVDGCTAIVNSKKLGDPKDLKKGQHANIRLNQEKMKVEVLELSDSKTLLNNFEDEWTLTHRSIALDKEKKRRKNKLNGYLDVWPTDVEEATPSEGDSEVEENEGERNKDDKLPKKNPEIRRTQKTTAKTSESKEKTGSNARKIVVLHEGSADLSDDICVPKRAPGFLDGLSADQIDLVTSQVTEFREGKRSVAVQTDQVIVLGPNNPIPEKKVEDMLKKILDSQTKELLPILKNISDIVTTRDFLSVLLAGLNQEEPLPVLRVRARSSSVPDVDLLDCLESSNSMELAAAPAPPSDSSKRKSPGSSSASTSSRNSPASSSNGSADTSRSSPEISSCESASSSLNLSPASITFVPSSTPLSSSPASTPLDSQSSSSSAHLSCDVPVCSDGQIRSPPLVASRVKKPSNFDCFTGPLHEISDGNDLNGVPSNAEIRIRQSVISDAMEESCSRGNLSWRLAQTVYRHDELNGRNYRGTRNKQALSPRRRHAIEHAVIENYGMTKETFYDIQQSINTGLRNMKMRHRPPLILVNPNNNSQV